MDDLAHLRDPLPGYAASYSSLHGKNTLEEGLGRPHGERNYAELCRLWVHKGMTSIRDLLIHYNNCEVVPFLTALQKQCDIYKQAELDMLKDGPSLPSISMRYGMRDAEGLFYPFGPDQAFLAKLLNTAIVGGPSIVFKRHAEVGHTTIWEPDYGAKALPCRALFGFDANSLYPWGMAQDMPIGACHIRSGPDFTADDGALAHGYGPHYSRASLQWLTYETDVHRLAGLLHAGNGPEVRLGLRHLPVDGYHPDTATVFQFHGCLYHRHDCCEFEDTWLRTTAKERRQSTQENEDYLRSTCGYTLITIWECKWEVLKRSDPQVATACKGQTGKGPQPPLPSTSLPDPGADMESILQAIREDRVFGLAQVDIHTPEDLKDKFRDLPPIFKSTMLSKEDAGPHMARFCETASLVSHPRMSLISSYFARRVLIPMPLLRWYLLNDLVVTQLYTLMQYNRSWCFHALAENCAQKRWDAYQGPSQALAGESAKLLMTSVHGKCCENKAHILQMYFVKGPVASKEVCSKCFRDMKPLLPAPLLEAAHSVRACPEMDPEDMSVDGWEPEDVVHATTAVVDTYELSMAPECLTMDLPFQIAVFIYAYAKLRMLQFGYDLLGQYEDHRCWEPLYMDTDSYYISLGRDSLHACLQPECKRAFYECFHEWFPSEACDVHRAEFVDIKRRLGPHAWYPARQCCEARRVYDGKTPGLFKTEWDSNGMVALSSKTYYCRDSQGQDKLSCLQSSRAVVSTAASGSDPVGKCIPIGRRGLPCLMCTLKGVWQTTASTQSRCTCEPHTACLPACLPAYLPTIWSPPALPMLANMRRTTCNCSCLFTCSSPVVPGMASPRWPFD